MAKIIKATCLCIVLLLLRAESASACNLYQKAKSVFLGQPCASYVTPYNAEVPYQVDPGGNPVTGTFYVRDVPKCESGLDTGCTEVIRCLDGTRPMVHIDPVAGSTDWVFTVEGGGSCGEENGNDAITDCYQIYTLDPVEAKEMSTEHAAAGILLPAGSHVPARRPGHGILRATSNTFSTYNRVAFNKCSYDRFMGNGSYEAMWNGDPVILHFHGRRIITAVLQDLNGTRGPITIDDIPLTQLGAATKIVFAGNSGGAGGLIMNMEYINGILMGMAPSASVSFVLDARALPGVEAEGKFDFVPSTLYSQDTNGRSPLYSDDGAVGTAIDRSLATYSIGGELRTLLKTWGQHNSVAHPYLDAGCLAYHTLNAAKCFDEMHVAAHHMNENVFWHQTLQDQVHRKTPWFWVDNVVPGFVVDDGSGGYTFNDERLDRVVYQLDQIFEYRKWPWVGPEVQATNRMGVYLVDGDKHNSLFTDDGFFDHVMQKAISLYETVNQRVGDTFRRLSFEQALSAFVNAPSDTCAVEDTRARFPFTNAACGGWTSPSW
jgi:hypothetical protein